MGERTEKRREERKANKLNITIWIFSMLMLIVSIVTWYIKFKGFELMTLITNAQLFFLVAIGLFFLASVLKIMGVILKGMMKLMFNVWIVAFILLSTLSSQEQSIYIVLAGFCVGYFEVLIDTHDVIRNLIENFKMKDYKFFDKFRFIGKEAFYNASKPLSIFTVSTLHMFLAFTVNDFISTLNFLK